MAEKAWAVYEPLSRFGLARPSALLWARVGGQAIFNQSGFACKFRKLAPPGLCGRRGWFVDIFQVQLPHGLPCGVNAIDVSGPHFGAYFLGCPRKCDMLSHGI